MCKQLSRYERGENTHTERERERERGREREREISSNILFR